jgi:hypothetical protein
MKFLTYIFAISFTISLSCQAAIVIYVGLFVQSSESSVPQIHDAFSRSLLSLGNIIVTNKRPYEEGIYVFVQPIRGAKGNLLGYSLAVTGTTSLAVLSGAMPDIQETRELYRSTSLQFVPVNEIYSVAAGIVGKLDKEQIEPERRLLSRIGS